jgi:ribonuclease BN (tRNA processing enzyme)
LKEAVSAKVRRMLLTHFDPTHSDATLAQMEEKVRRAVRPPSLDVAFARQGQTLEI